MHKRNTTYTKYLIVIGILLAILALIFFNTYAKYTDEGSGLDNTRGTVFAVDASDESSDASGTTGSINKILDSSDASVVYYSFSVSNTKDGQVSEAALEYEIIVGNIDQSTSGVNLTIIDQEGQSIEPYSYSSAEGYRFKYVDKWYFPASVETNRNLRLCFSSTSSMVSGTYSNIQVQADFRQVD